jgi:hypothetical protein
MPAQEEDGDASGQHQPRTHGCIERDAQPEARTDEQANSGDRRDGSHTPVDANCGIGQVMTEVSELRTIC